MLTNADSYMLMHHLTQTGVTDVVLLVQNTLSCRLEKATCGGQCSSRVWQCGVCPVVAVLIVSVSFCAGSNSEWSSMATSQGELHAVMLSIFAHFFLY